MEHHVLAIHKCLSDRQSQSFFPLFEKQSLEISIPIMKVSLTDIKMLRNSLIILELRTHWHFSHDMLNIVDLHITSGISFGLFALIDGIRIRWNFKQAILASSWFGFSTKFKPTVTGLVSSDSTSSSIPDYSDAGNDYIRIHALLWLTWRHNNWWVEGLDFKWFIRGWKVINTHLLHYKQH